MNRNMQKIAAGFTSPGRRGFTLIEVVVSIFILIILFSGILLAFHRTQESVYDFIIRERAAAAAQRRMELLLANNQEPNSLHLHGRDDLDPLFLWTLDLERILIDDNSVVKTTDNTVIKATVRVEADLPQVQNQYAIELVRYFDLMRPMSGSDVAVPLPASPNARWLENLKEKLGREPTIDEIFNELIRIGEITPEMSEQLGLPGSGIIKDIR